MLFCMMYSSYAYINAHDVRSSYKQQRGAPAPHPSFYSRHRSPPVNGTAARHRGATQTMATGTNLGRTLMCMCDDDDDHLESHKTTWARAGLFGCQCLPQRRRRRSCVADADGMLLLVGPHGVVVAAASCSSSGEHCWNCKSSSNLAGSRAVVAALSTSALLPLLLQWSCCLIPITIVFYCFSLSLCALCRRRRSSSFCRAVQSRRRRRCCVAAIAIRHNYCTLFLLKK